MSAFEALRFVSADEVEADMLCYRGAGCWRRAEIFGGGNPGTQRNIESRGQRRVMVEASTCIWLFVKEHLAQSDFPGR